MSRPKDPIRVQVLAFNDFHGNLEAPAGGNGRIRVPGADGTGGSDVNAGGAAYLAHHIERLRQENPENTVVVSAGDLIGATPLASGIFHDEPTIDVMNMMGLDINSVGNHEFDEGFTELLRMQNGGCHPVDGCQASTTFAGASFKFLSANVFTDVAARKTLFPAYGIREFQGVKVAFIGMTLEATPLIVSPTGVRGLTFQDEADTVNALIPELKQQGVEAIVVVIHEGGIPSGSFNACPGISGPIKAIVERLDDEVDVVASGHTHQAYNCVLDGKRVTSAASNGRLLTDIDLVLDPTTHDVVDTAARNVVVTRETAHAQVEAFVTGVIGKVAPVRDRVIGHTPNALAAPVRPLPAGASGESTLGNAVADGMLAATRDEFTGGAVIAMQNPGGADRHAAGAAVPAGRHLHPPGVRGLRLLLVGVGAGGKQDRPGVHHPQRRDHRPGGELPRHGEQLHGRRRRRLRGAHRGEGPAHGPHRPRRVRRLHARQQPAAHAAAGPHHPPSVTRPREEPQVPRSLGLLLVRTRPA
jgi:5'-nucleotidase